MSSPLFKQSYSAVNLFRVVLTLFATWMSVTWTSTTVLFIILLFLFFSIIWYFLSESKILDEQGLISLFPTTLDVSIIALFCYLTGSIRSPGVLLFFYTTIICSMNTKTHQGIFAVVLSSMYFLGMNFLIYCQLLPYVNILDNSFSKISYSEMISVGLLFPISNIGLFFIIRDLSIKNERLLKKAEASQKEAEASNAAKRNFLANISHEIRTPMNGVIGMARLLKNTSLDDDQVDFVDSIIISGDSLLTIINDILDFSKIEANRMDLESVPFSLNKALSEVYTIFKLRFQEKEIDWQIHFEPQMPTAFFGDPVRIKQIFINLIGNAIKFTPARGSIQVNGKKVSELETDIVLEFCVKDSGVGIPKEALALLFTPFQQADTSVTRKFGGTGLGLSIVERLVQLMQGMVWVESQVGIGSQFYFQIQLKKSKPGNVTLEPKERKKTKVVIESSFKTLCVDDNDMNIKVISKLLKQMNITHDIAKSGREAIMLCYLNNYDFVFMDIQMPVIDGIEATRRIRKFGPYLKKEPIIVALSANANEEDKSLAMKMGMDDFLLKPVTSNQILSVITKHSQD